MDGLRALMGKACAHRKIKKEGEKAQTEIPQNPPREKSRRNALNTSGSETGLLLILALIGLVKKTFPLYSFFLPGIFGSSQARKKKRTEPNKECKARYALLLLLPLPPYFPLLPLLP